MSHLGFVRLPASLCVGILLLPHLALVIEALAPLTSLDVEAIGVSVSALGVIFRRHSIECRIKLSPLGVYPFIGLFDGERDTTTLQVDVNDLDKYLVARGHDLFRELDVLFRELRDVDEALNAISNSDKGTKGNKLGYCSRCNLANGVGAGENLPRVFLCGLERQGYTLSVHIDLENFHRDFLTDLDHFTGVLDVLPAQFGNVHETVHAAEVNEGAEVDDGGHNTLTDLTLGKVLQEGRAVFTLAGLEERST